MQNRLFFPTPTDALLISLVLGASKKAFKIATVCLIGSVTGALFGYAVGHFLWKFDPQIKLFIDKYFNWLAIAFTVLLKGGFEAIKYIF